MCLYILEGFSIFGERSCRYFDVGVGGFLREVLEGVAQLGLWLHEMELELKRVMM